MTDHPPATAASKAEPVIARHAASLLVLREGAAGPEVLMGMRGAGHSFMPNRLVFPGGRVDPEDHHAPAATPLPEHVLRLLTRHTDASLAHALGIAVARELDEETGLTLGTPPELDGLDYLCRAITPPASPKRFDARFFVVSSTRVHGTIAGSGELEGLRYYGLSEALGLDLAFATQSTLTRLQQWLAMTEEERRSRPTVPVLRERKWSND